MNSPKLPVSVFLRGLTRLRQMTWKGFRFRSANPSFSPAKDRKLEEINRVSGSRFKGNPNINRLGLIIF
jgi:hypothetical protein